LQFDAFVIAQHGGRGRRHGAPVLTLVDIAEAGQGAAIAALFLWSARVSRSSRSTEQNPPDA
ncbi:hypothetical protein, partial [Paraburkholderia caribensis]